VMSEDSVIRMYDTADFVETHRLAGTSGWPTQLKFSPDGSRLVSAKPGEVRTWDISDVGPRELGNFHVSGGQVHRLVVAADRSTAYATVSTDAGTLSAVRRVDLDNGSDDEVLVEVPYYFSTRPLVSPDLSVVASMDTDDDYTSALIPLGGVGGEPVSLGRCESVRAFSFTGRVAAVDANILCREQGQDPTRVSRIVDRTTGETLLVIEGRAIYAADFGPPDQDGVPRLAVVEDFPTEAVTLYDLSNGGTIGVYQHEGDFATSLAVSPDGGRLALLTESGRLKVLDVSRITGEGDQADAVVFKVAAHNSGSKAVAFSASGLIATGSSLDGLRVWSPEGDLLANIPTRQKDGPTFTFAPGTDTLFYEDADGVVRRFDIDFDAVTELARSLLTRELTPQECDRYFPDQTCPTFGVEVS
jgi:WD40 repeat protein